MAEADAFELRKGLEELLGELPTGGRALRPALWRRDDLVVSHTTAASAPCERAGEGSENG